MIRYSPSTLLLAVVCCAVLVNPTHAQDGLRDRHRDEHRGRAGFGPSRGGPGAFRRGGGELFGLLMNEKIRIEIEMTADQSAALEKLRRSDGRSQKRVDWRGMSDEKRRKLFEKMREQRRQRDAEMREMLEEVLLPKQINRIEQISLQIRDVEALGDERIAEELRVTVQQRDELGKVREQIQQEIRRKVRSLIASGDRERVRQVLTKMRDEHRQAALQVLSEEQKSKFESMKGAKFDLSELAQGRRSGRQRNRKK